jgi:hypothetical protein
MSTIEVLGIMLGAIVAVVGDTLMLGKGVRRAGARVGAGTKTMPGPAADWFAPLLLLRLDRTRTADTITAITATKHMKIKNRMATLMGRLVLSLLLLLLFLLFWQQGNSRRVLLLLLRDQHPQHGAVVILSLIFLQPSACWFGRTSRQRR